MRKISHCIHFFVILLLIAVFCALQPQAILAAHQLAHNSQNLAQTLETTSAASSSATTSGSLTTTRTDLETSNPLADKDSDITDGSGAQKDKLATYLTQFTLEPLSWKNFVKYAIYHAIQKGLPANVVVLVLLFPLIASLIAASRHIIGLRGFGIYVPAVLSVAFASTGMIEGLIIFIAIITAALFSKQILKKLRLSYLPRTALLLWMISCGILLILVVSPWFNLLNLIHVDIFPVLILVLLAENFLSAQASTKESDAFALTLETIVLALAGAFFLNWEFLQKLALTEPEIIILSSGALNILVGRFVGLRVTEWLRFRPIIEE